MKTLKLLIRIFLLPKKEKEKVADFINKQKRKKKKMRSPGLAKGVIVMKDNFDDPIEGFEPYT